MSQNDLILRHLGKRTINPMQALELYGTLRLSGRIYDLRQKGHVITTTMVENGDGSKRFARYKLIKPKPRSMKFSRARNTDNYTLAA